MKTLEEYKNDFLKLSKMFLNVLQTGEMVEPFSVTRFATATAAIFSAGGSFPKEEAFDDLFYDIEFMCRKSNPLQKDNHGTILSFLMYCLLLYQSSNELNEDYYDIQQLKKEFSSEQGRKILEYIEEHPGCLQKEVAGHVGMTECNMSHYMAKYGKYQLWDVDRSGRSNYLTITPEGRRLIQFMNEEIKKDDFPYNVNEENTRLKKEVVELCDELREKNSQIEELTVITHELISALIKTGAFPARIDKAHQYSYSWAYNPLLDSSKDLIGIQKKYEFRENIGLGA